MKYHRKQTNIYSNFFRGIASRRVAISRSKYHTRCGASSVMCKICKYSRDVIPCVRSSYCIVSIICLLYTFSFKEYLNVKIWSMFSNVIVFSPSLILRDSDTDSENVSLIRLSVLHGQKTCSSKVVSLIGIK